MPLTSNLCYVHLSFPCRYNGRILCGSRVSTSWLDGKDIVELDVPENLLEVKATKRNVKVYGGRYWSSRERSSRSSAYSYHSRSPPRNTSASSYTSRGHGTSHSSHSPIGEKMRRSPDSTYSLHSSHHSPTHSSRYSPTHSSRSSHQHSPLRSRHVSINSGHTSPTDSSRSQSPIRGRRVSMTSSHGLSPTETPRTSPYHRRHSSLEDRKEAERPSSHLSSYSHGSVESVGSERSSFRPRGRMRSDSIEKKGECLKDRNENGSSSRSKNIKKRLGELAVSKFSGSKETPGTSEMTWMLNSPSSTSLSDKDESQEIKEELSKSSSTATSSFVTNRTFDKTTLHGNVEQLLSSGAQRSSVNMAPERSLQTDQSHSTNSGLMSSQSTVDSHVKEGSFAESLNGLEEVERRTSLNSTTSTGRPIEFEQCSLNYTDDLVSSIGHHSFSNAFKGSSTSPYSSGGLNQLRTFSSATADNREVNVQEDTQPVFKVECNVQQTPPNVYERDETPPADFLEATHHLAQGEYMEWYRQLFQTNPAALQQFMEYYHTMFSTGGEERGTFLTRDESMIPAGTEDRSMLHSRSERECVFPTGGGEDMFPTESEDEETICTVNKEGNMFPTGGEGGGMLREDVDMFPTRDEERRGVFPTRDEGRRGVFTTRDEERGVFSTRDESKGMFSLRGEGGDMLHTERKERVLPTHDGLSADVSKLFSDQLSLGNGGSLNIQKKDIKAPLDCHISASHMQSTAPLKQPVNLTSSPCIGGDNNMDISGEEEPMDHVPSGRESLGTVTEILRSSDISIMELQDIVQKARAQHKPLSLSKNKSHPPDNWDQLHSLDKLPILGRGLRERDTKSLPPDCVGDNVTFGPLLPPDYQSLDNATIYSSLESHDDVLPSAPPIIDTPMVNSSPDTTLPLDSWHQGNNARSETLPTSRNTGFSLSDLLTVDSMGEGSEEESLYSNNQSTMKVESLMLPGDLTQSPHRGEEEDEDDLYNSSGGTHNLPDISHCSPLEVTTVDMGVQTSDEVVVPSIAATSPLTVLREIDLKYSHLQKAALREFTKRSRTLITSAQIFIR